MEVLSAARLFVGTYDQLIIAARVNFNPAPRISSSEAYFFCKVHPEMSLKLAYSTAVRK